MSGLIKIGDKVIVQRDDTYHVVEVQPTGWIVFGRTRVPISSIIGYPIGSTFYFDGKNVSQSEGGETALDNVATESSKDNRNLFDRPENQCLTAEEINSLKSSGNSGNEIISKLIENSATFKLKTKYSQEKYLKKKKKSYLFLFTIRPHTSRAVADMICYSGKQKSTSMRYDSLVQLMTYGNVHAGSTVMTTDSHGGLVSKAILERLGHRNFGGKLISFFHGTSPPIVDIKPKDEYSPVYNVRFTDVTSLLLTGKFSRYHHHQDVGQGEQQNNNPPPKKLHLDDAVEGRNEVPDLAPAEGEEEEEDPKGEAGDPELAPKDQPPPCRRLGKRARIRYAIQLTDAEKAQLLAERLAREADVRRVLCPADDELAPDLEGRPDCLIVATRFHPVEMTLLLLQFLPPGRPFVVHSHLLAPLVDLYNILKRRGCCIHLALQDSWLRPMQVLPNRSHPEMRMSAGGGGFILRGYTVQRREDSDALLSRRVMYRSTKELFDEGLILHAQ